MVLWYALTILVSCCGVLLLLLYRGVKTTIHTTILYAFNNKIQYFNSSYSCYYCIRELYQIVILVCLNSPDPLNASVVLKQVFIENWIVSKLSRFYR